MNTPTGTAVGAPASTPARAVVFHAVTPGGRRRPLAALYRTEVLHDASAGQDPTDRSVRSFARHLSLREASADTTADTTADVDPWDDVRGSDLDRPLPTKGQRMPKEMTPEERQLLSAWVEDVTAEFDLGDVEVPVEELLALAGAVSTGVARPAVPVTAYLAGYLAAVRARGAEPPDPPRTVRDVTAVVPAPTTDRPMNGSRRRA